MGQYGNCEEKNQTTSPLKAKNRFTPPNPCTLREGLVKGVKRNVTFESFASCFLFSLTGEHTGENVSNVISCERTSDSIPKMYTPKEGLCKSCLRIVKLEILNT